MVIDVTLGAIILAVIAVVVPVTTQIFQWKKTKLAADVLEEKNRIEQETITSELSKIHTVVNSRFTIINDRLAEAYKLIETLKKELMAAERK